MFRVDNSLPFAAFVNMEIFWGQYMGYDALKRQAQLAYEGDPLAANGGTSFGEINWRDTTEVQSSIIVYYGASGQGLPPDLHAILAANAGPDLPWNWSYAKWAAQGALKLD